MTESGNLDIVVMLLGFLLAWVCLFGRTEIGVKSFSVVFGAGDKLWERMAAGSAGSIVLGLESLRLIPLLGPIDPSHARTAAALIILPIFLYCVALWLHDWDRNNEKSRLTKLAFFVILAAVLCPLALILRFFLRT